MTAVDARAESRQSAMALYDHRSPGENVEIGVGSFTG